jgi:spore coat-associated protein N
MGSIWRRPSLARKILASLTLLALAASLAGLGAWATFTSTVSQSQTLASGTVTIALGATGAATNRLNIGASNLAAGDTVQRAVNLTNSGSISLASITLTTTASPSTALDTDATNGLQMVIDKCSQAWTEGGSAPAYTYTCGGTTQTVVASRAVIGSGLSLSNLGILSATGTDYLRVTLTLPSGAGNTLQNLSSTITYSFTATQRNATNA